MRSSATRLFFVSLVIAVTFGATAQSSDPFALTPPLVSQAITSCGDMAISNGLIDSSATAGRGNILSNGTIKVTGGRVDGDATAGPGSTVKLSGNGTITGTIASATTAFPCSIIDLAALSATLASANDNTSIPLTAQGKVAVASNGDFKLSGGDSLTLQAGTYYFHKFTISGGSTLTLAGPVRILTTSDVSVSGGSVAGASPWQLHFWSAATKFDLGSSTFAGFIYAPSAPVTISAEIISGRVYGGTVTVTGNSHITRMIDDTPPQITIDSPTDGQPLSDLSNVVVRGKVIDPETALTSFTVNGTSVTPASDGTFSVTISLGGIAPAKITAVAANAAGLSATTSITVQAAMTQILTVPTSLTINQNATGQLRATATYADGTTSDVTSLATWTSASTAIATVNGGVVTGIRPGTTTITATLGPLTASSTVTVNAVLQSIAVSPQTVSIAIGAKQSFTAAGTYSDGTTSDVSTAVTWSSSDATIATIDSHGLATGVAPGVATIRATQGTIAGSASLTVLPAPTITSVQPARGKTAGGNAVTITGTNFASIATTSVTFGGTSASITNVTPTTLTVSTPAHAAGAVDVAVTTPGGTATAAGVFTFVAPPTVSSIAPAAGKAVGGDAVVITGTNFDASGTSVSIGGAAALNIVVVSATSLTAVTPAATAGVADLVVTTAGGAASLPGAFTYVPLPVITSISPTQALAGSSVAISGSNFDPTPAKDLVTFGGIPALVTSASTSQLVVAVPVGANSGPVQVTTVGGVAVSSQSFTVITYQRIALSAASVTLQVGQQQQLTATVTLSDGSAIDVTASATWSVDDGTIASAAAGLVTGLKGGTTTVRGTYAGLSATTTVTVVATNPLPPDPTTIATAIDPTKPTSFADSIAFLYGPNGTQSAMTPGAINTAHVNVIRGRVLDTAGAPISGVRVSALRSPEVGYTLTRADGTYDLVVNGGGWVVVAFGKDGLITAHRSVHTSWQDFTVVDDVRMTAYDSRATTIDLTQGAAIAQGSVVTDADGTRQATLLFPAGATATAVKPDGSTAALSTLTVRATEQTVGKDGAMPADIAPGTAYTYCVELSADEAVAIGATTIQFSKPVALYVDGFLNFPVGSNVPAGFYDRMNARWVPIASGRVVKIVAISGGLASLDITGDGVADDASAIGITDVERGQLALLYSVGKTLWRVSLDHFTPIDLNWAPDDAEIPDEGEGAVDPSVEGQSCQAGSVIECESDSLGKTIPISGTPYTLEYRSRDAAAYTGNRTLDVRLTGPTIPASLKRVDLTLVVAGQHYVYTFAPAPNLTQTFTWDGRDGYGRFNYLDKDLSVHIAYVYNGVYKGGGTFSGDAFALLTSVATRREISLSQDYAVRLSGPRPTQGLGGWFISTVHSYDAGSHLLRLGSGEDVNMEARGDTGQQEAFAPQDAGAVFTGPDGSVYAYGPFLLRIARVDSSGLFSVIAGGFTASGPTTDGSPAVGASISVRGFAPLPDGDYVFTTSDPSGAGYNLMLIHNGLLKKLTSTISFHININSVTAAPDGTILIADDLRGISAVDKSGNLTSVYPEASFAVFGANPNVDQAVYKEDGRLYVYLTTVPDGFFALHKVLVLQNGAFKEIQSPCANHVFNFTARPDGSLLFNCGCSNIFTTTPSIKIVATDGSASDYTSVPAVSTCNAAFASLPNGQLVRSESTNTTSGVCAPQKACVMLGGVPIPFAAAGGSYTVGTPDGSVGLKFNIDGRLTEARHALTNALLYSVAYTSSGLPSTLTDPNGLVTQIERAADGTPSAIVAPNGDRTTLAIGTDGLLSQITLPGSIQHAFTYDNGSLRKYTDPRGFDTNYDYDASGRLAAAHDAAGGSKTITFTRGGNIATTQLTTGLGQTSTYQVQSFSPGTVNRLVTSAGLTTSINVTPLSTSVRNPDGTAISTTRAADPLWGASGAYVSNQTITLPSGNAFTMTRARTATASNSSDPLTLTGFTDTSVINGFLYKTTYSSATRTLRLTTPKNRVIDRVFDTRGRLTTIRMPGQSAVTIAYDARGHVASISQGSRVKTFVWDATSDQLTSVGDATGMTNGYSYDSTQRPVTQVLPGNRSVTVSYDQSGDLTSLTVPGRSAAHTFGYNPVNRLTSWLEPSGLSTTYSVDPDRRLTGVLRPSGAAINLTFSGSQLSTVSDTYGTRQYSYDSGGHAATITAPGGPTVSFAYDGMLPTTESWSGAGISGSVGVTYNSDFLPLTISVNGSPISHSYDDDGLLMSAGSITFTRDASSGFPLSATLGTLRDTFTVNTFGELASDTVNAGASTVFSLAYGRDSGGRLSSVNETANGQTTATTYSYDNAGRLSDVSVAGSVVRHYDYDTNGNRIAKTDSNGSVPATFDDQDHLLSFAGSAYTYTADGGLQTKTDATGTTTYSYDAFGLLRRVVLPSGDVVDYVIDGQNRRVGKKLNGTLVQGWLYAGQLRIVAETDGSGTITKRFVYGLRNNVPDYMVWAGSMYRFVSDNLGSPRYLLESSGGTVAESLTYDEFGSLLSDSNPGFQPFRFAGGLYDPDTKLVHFGFREYDPQTGRWTTRDPLGLAGGDTNLYNYASENPVTMTDPTGLYTGVDDAAFILGGALVGVASEALLNVATTGSLVGEGSDYLAAALGGAVGGEALLYTGPALAGAAGAAVANGVRQWRSNCPPSIASFVVDTALGAATGALFGGGLRPGITEGNGSYVHVFRTQTSLLKNGETHHVAVRTAVKMFAGRAEETAALQGTITGGAIGAAISGESPTCGCH